MVKDKLFDLITAKFPNPQHEDKYNCFYVDGLISIFPREDDGNDLTNAVDGAVGLLRSKKHPGYCQLFYSHHDTDEDDIVLTYHPAYTAAGEYIFIKYPSDCTFCLFDRGKTESEMRMYKELGKDVNPNGRLTFSKNYGIDYQY